jgi:hypothetical protein
VKTIAPLAALVLAFGLACAGGEGDDAVVDADQVATPEPADPAPATMDGEGGQDVVVVPVPAGSADGTHWCCEYTDAGVTKYALTTDKLSCETTYSTKSARWVDGAQCIPCCCKSPNDAGNLDLGYSFALTTPSACAGSGECAAMTGTTCGPAAEGDDEEDVTPRPAPPSPRSDGVSGKRPPTRPVPTRPVPQPN